jgi:hypothetical protein
MPKITYYNGSTNYYSGQTNMEAVIYVDRELAGYVEYVLYDGELTVSDIQIEPKWRRKGMGSRLMKYIKEENPEYTYVPSYKTELGAAFVHKDISLYERQGFQRGGDPKYSIGIGLIKTITDEMLEDVERGKYWNKYGTRIGELLTWATSKDKAEYVKYLLDHGAKDFVHMDDEGPLRTAVNHSNTEILRMLLDAGANPKIYGNYLITYGSPEIIEEYKNWRRGRDKRRKENRISESMDFQRGGNPYDRLDIGNEELRILKKLRRIADELGLEDVGIEDLNKDRAVASWRVPRPNSPEGFFIGTRITFFRNGPFLVPLNGIGKYKYGVFIMGRNGTDTQDWKKWDTADKWRSNISRMNEGLSFERGMDPKTSMGIGSAAKMAEIKNMGVENIRNIFSDVEADYIKVLTGGKWSIQHPEDFMVPYKHGADIYKTYKKPKYTSRKYSNSFRSFITDRLRSIFSDTPNAEWWIAIGINSMEPIFNRIMKDRMEILDESASFIRGLDPKRALEIGLPSKMGEGFTVIWRDKKNRWSIEKCRNPHTKEWDLVVVSDDWVENPIMYSNGDISYDNPYRIPKYVKEMVKKIYHKIRGLEESISFERGIDPKEAMRIGNRDIQLTDKIDKTISQLGFRKRPEISVEGIGNSNVVDIAEWWGLRGEICVFYKLLDEEKYLIMVTNKKGIATGLSENEFFNIKIWKNILSDRPNFWNSESISFERGMDPKESLKIGKDWRRKKILKELKKVTDFFNEPWLEDIFPEYVQKIEDLGIELIQLIPKITLQNYGSISVVTVFWKGSDGREMEDTVNIPKNRLYDKDETFRKNEAINVLYPIIDTIEWHQHILIK